MPDQPPQQTPRLSRRVRLVPVVKSGEKKSHPFRDLPDAVPVARETLRRAHKRVGPEGLADVESQLAAAQEVRDDVERGGRDEVRGNPEDATFPVRLCTNACPFRMGGPGCGVYQSLINEGSDIDGGQCERDIAILRETQRVFEEGDEAAVRGMAGRFSGAIYLKIRELFDQIITDGTVIHEPIFDQKGAPVTTEEVITDASGNPIIDNEGKVQKRRIVLTRPREHPLWPRLTQLLKETRLIDLSQWQLTPKSSGAPPMTDGMILLAEEGGGKTTLTAIQGDIRKGLEAMQGAQERARKRRMEDPAFKAITDRQGGV